jgi:hypothetical protein
MHRQALQLNVEVFGQKHPNTLTSIYCLAYLLQSQKKYDKAQALYQRATSGYQKILGTEHPTTSGMFKALLFDA